MKSFLLFFQDVWGHMKLENIAGGANPLQSIPLTYNAKHTYPPHINHVI